MKMRIIQDTREKNGWNFIFDENLEVAQFGLDCGDYTTARLRDRVRIERKASTGELYNNLATKKAKDRFYREMEKLEKFEHGYIVCEFPESYLHEFPNNSGIPPRIRKFVRIKSRYFTRLVREITEDFDVSIFFFDNRSEAEKFTYNMLLDIESSL